MSSTLGRHSLRLVFALVCVVVLTRLPPVGLAEDAWSSSGKIEGAVAFVSDVPVHSTDVNVAPATIVFSLVTLTGSVSSAVPSAEHSILRL